MGSGYGKVADAPCSRVLEECLAEVVCCCLEKGLPDLGSSLREQPPSSFLHDVFVGVPSALVRARASGFMVESGLGASGQVSLAGRSF